jgi:hypothetical protein
MSEKRKIEEELWAGSGSRGATCSASGPDLVGVGKQRAARGVSQRQAILGQGPSGTGSEQNR